MGVVAQKHQNYFPRSSFRIAIAIADASKYPKVLTRNAWSFNTSENMTALSRHTNIHERRDEAVDSNDARGLSSARLACPTVSSSACRQPSNGSHAVTQLSDD